MSVLRCAVIRRASRARTRRDALLDVFRDSVGGSGASMGCVMAGGSVTLVGASSAWDALLSSATCGHLRIRGYVLSIR
ncbi:hypothetical protein MPRI_00280 [Mycobacterium paraintracellulare]|uniref:Uncharacterized protein n=1 Tax=Mycobacterium paraintracellulare TaxID=1138383 RepID=A0ABN6AFG7_9MYCO|nr:hypothetical protein MPRI_00280 [Mycobacterium paraintracellulare]